MESIRRKHDPAFKARVGLAAIRGDETIAQTAARFQVHPGQVRKWKKQVEEGAAAIFGQGQASKNAEALTAQLYQQIGKLKVERDFLESRLGS